MAYSAMTKRSAGYVVPASEWNKLIDNDDYLKAERDSIIAMLNATGGVATLPGTWPGSISDDTAISFTPINVYGALLIHLRTSGKLADGLVAYRTDSSPATRIIVGLADLQVTTGVLSGTTGTDGKMTISTHTNGMIYIENRLGTSISLTYVQLGH